MGSATKSAMSIILTPDNGSQEHEISGGWKLSIRRGPTMMVREAFIDIRLDVQDSDGTRTRLQIDPNAPTIETIDKLGRSDSLILQALFRGFTMGIID